MGKSGLTEHDIELWKERKKLDRECSVDEEITMLRKKSGWSQEELALKLGISRQSVSKWETGVSQS